MRRSWLVVLVAGCGSSDATPSQDVSVALASVTLADDCGARGVLPPPKITADADGDSEVAVTRCEQTSMQLSIKAPAAAKVTAIRVKKVELLDDKGKLLETLTSKQPSRWAGKRYVAWNQSIAGGETLATSYVLSSPNWGKLTNGRRNAHTKKFQLRVTLTVGTKNRMVEKTATAPAMIEPDIDT